MNPKKEKVAEPDVLPIGDEPLDAIQAALVRMWVNILADEIRAELAAEIREEEIMRTTVRKTKGGA